MTDYYETKSQPISRVMVWKAYQKVKENKGGSGIDKMTWEDLDRNLNKNLYKLWNRLTSGSYFPASVKEVEIKKKDGGIRKLGIPTILDRIAQQVVRALFRTNSRTTLSRQFVRLSPTLQLSSSHRPSRPQL